MLKPILEHFRTYIDIDDAHTLSTASFFFRAPSASGGYPEDFNNPGKCPKYEAARNFDVDKYMGIWCVRNA